MRLGRCSAARGGGGGSLGVRLGRCSAARGGGGGGAWG